MLRPFFPELVMSMDFLGFKHPSVLLFCFLCYRSRSLYLWPFDPKLTDVLLRSRSTYMWSNIIVCQMEEELLYRKHFFTDGQTDGQTDWQAYGQTSIVKPVYLHNFVGGDIQTFFNVEKSLKKWPPWRSKFHLGVTFSRSLVQNLMLEFEPCQLLTLTNDPGSHF